MFILVITINLISMFFLICALNVIRKRYNLANTSPIENLGYKSSFVILNCLSLLVCLYQWGNPGWLIWINLTSINAIIVALGLGFYPSIYIKWIGIKK